MTLDANLFYTAIPLNSRRNCLAGLQFGPIENDQTMSTRKDICLVVLNLSSV